jgi:tRNA threonylcarbamoyladenosine biosynthesis protein TsaE
MKYQIQSERGLAPAAKKLWSEILKESKNRGVIIGLIGPLGVGKTRFVKTFGEIAGLDSTVSSPSFVLHIPHFEKRNSIFMDHVDVWRMESVEELKELKIEELLQQNHVVLIEWADKFEEQIKSYSKLARVVWIKMEYGDKENSREIEIEEL